MASKKTETKKKAIGKRFRNTRDDASIGSMSETIEIMLDLPAGSVRLVKPNGKYKRSDASIKSLRQEWYKNG